MNAPVVGQPQRLGGEVVGRVIDYRVGTKVPHQIGFAVVGDRPDHVRAIGLGDLHGRDPDPACGGVNQHYLLGRDVMGRVQQVVRGKYLDGEGRPFLEAHEVRERDYLSGRSQRILRIGLRADISDASTGLEVLNAVSDRFDDTSRFQARSIRKTRHRDVLALAKQNVGEIDSDSVVLH